MSKINHLKKEANLLNFFELLKTQKMFDFGVI